MHNRVTWKKGMRLSTEVFNAMDNAEETSLCMVSLLGSAGRCGLFPTAKPFELTVNISGNTLEVLSLSCHGITKSGCIVDVDFDSNYNNTFDTRVAIPSDYDNDAFYLVLRVREGQWREINETYSELCYTFELVGENSPIGDNCLPIGLLVNQYGWRMDETDFVPPCLYVTAHPKYVEQLDRAKTYAKELLEKCLVSQDCVAKFVLAEVWRSASIAFARFDKERDTLTPGQLISSLQQLVSSFVVGFFADDHVSLENQEPFETFMHKPYDARNIYKDIETGLSLCAEIDIKMDKVCDIKEEIHPIPVPVPRPASRPLPQPTPDERPHRHLWDGYEI